MITLYGNHTIYLVVDNAPEEGRVLGAFTRRSSAKEFIKEARAAEPVQAQYYDVVPINLRQ